ncbi:PREDICTED: otopetrin-1-like [Priapulus caudatus]|uniref:Otopetrin-1-like n=1 Tax=Priapulus caudatus TaxID=37621 RepID=A0ABM1DXY3_PRICU|nr:PREDICTED: otopetrin-1-like [Priapulus caudatus]
MLPRQKDEDFKEDSKEAKKQAVERVRHSSSVSLWRTLSLLYGLLIISMGTVLPIAEIMTNKIDIYFYEGFYVYLYGFSILFLVYVYLYLVRSSKTSSYRRSAIPCRSETFEITPQGVKKVDTNDDTLHTGSFYMRVGAVVFGVGSMIFSGLRFGQFFEIQHNSDCFNLMRGITPIALMVFFFFQLYFIFLNAKMAVHQYKGVARFGLMHMAATNLCVWIGWTIKEIVHAVNFKRLNQPEVETVTATMIEPANGNDSGVEAPLGGAGMVAAQHDLAPWEMRDDCVIHPIMGTIIEDTAPYLYPLLVEHCIIVSAILLAMWSNIDSLVTVDRGSGGGASDDDDEDSECTSKEEYRTDCHSTNKGLFCGIFVVVLAIISLILFFVLVGSAEYGAYGVLASHSFEILLYLVATVFVVSAFLRTQGLRFDAHFSAVLDHALLYASVVGVYAYALVGIVASHHGLFGGGDDGDGGGALAADFLARMQEPETWQSMCILVASVLVVVQATLQTMFVVDASRRHSCRAEHETRKPGRELVTFLLMCNVAMWAINTFEPRRALENPVQLRFFGFVPWTIISAVVVPLTIFYRFHSTVCLVEIWRRAYKVKLL